MMCYHWYTRLYFATRFDTLGCLIRRTDVMCELVYNSARTKRQTKFFLDDFFSLSARRVSYLQLAMHYLGRLTEDINIYIYTYT